MTDPEARPAGDEPPEVLAESERSVAWSASDPAADLGPPDERGRDEGALLGDRVDARGHLHDTEVSEGDLEALGAGADEDDRTPEASIEFLESLELRAGETDDANVAAEEGLAYVPPSDPPIVPGDGGAPQVAAGFGATAMDEPYDSDHHGSALEADDEMTARVREALLADAATSALAERVGIDTAAGVVRLTGQVEDMVDEENAIEVASRVSGVVEIRSELDVRAL